MPTYRDTIEYSLVGQSEYQTFYRLYLWDDGTLVKLTPTLDDVLSRSQIFMYHLDNPDDEFIVEGTRRDLVLCHAANPCEQMDLC
jgi:hypothetical protein